ncbi:uncharacterized protein HMPREF1541_00083 [Cyphellophora europaea CBS 101466]|uniref:HbrB-like protein n=1 Tax=Cyphellophora europaea (strain CBS 101466) TaxID=1220924 RepID=W2SB38_CYPE1|nr:uncharacterized protein HMPREF1541_00083 [Cyphellophora europaea CBS 101466]ETN45902.1 hypothetical protein HMPREF1541_00083 [Cyphellophora europaea CBS 101466]
MEAPPSANRRNAPRSPAPPPPTSPPVQQPPRAVSNNSARPDSSDSDASSSSNLSVVKRSPYSAQFPTFASHANPTSPNPGYTRPSAQYMPQDGTRKNLGPPPELQRHRPRQHSQGYFEPSLPSASLASQSAIADANMPHLTPSQIAAQAAFSHMNLAVPGTNHSRRRSQTVPVPDWQQTDGRRNSKGSATSSQDETTPPEKPQYKNGLVGNNAATTAASAAFPRLTSASQVSLGEEKESKSRFKKFKPKNITLSRDKDREPKEKPLPSPNKLAPSGLSRVMNASTASLADSLSSNNSSLYQLNANPSQATIIPIPPEKDKHKHHGLRQKLKLKDKDDHTLPLSSAHSNSKPADLDNPQSLYNFTPSSPGLSSGFSKSVSGLDLRHGGRALREKKKEEKAQQAAAALQPVQSRESDTSEWPALGTSTTNLSAGTWTPYAQDLSQTLAGFGLNNMTPDDAWDFLKAKLLSVFEGEHVRITVEDLNKLVSIYIQRCVQKVDPSIIVGDFEDLLRTGFLSLNHTLRSVRDDQLVPHLVSMWITVFTEVLPYMQAVFLPLDQEFKGRGAILTTPAKAAEFWGMIPNSANSALSSSPPIWETSHEMVAAGDELEVRRILLIAYRDIVILPRFDVLKATFSRLSLDSIHATLAHLESEGRTRGNSDLSDRPGTAQSLDPTYASYNSQASTLLSGAMTSSGGRSRATSNLSNGSNPAQDVAFQSFSSPQAARATDNTPSQVTETVGRMLQCLSVLCSVQTGDDAQTKMEELNKQLKLNWLGRGRTGRNRKGFVGTRMRTVRSAGASTLDGRGTIRAVIGEREGSPTPTPTRQGTVSRQSDER